jgi:hypothetical protein
MLPLPLLIVHIGAGSIGILSGAAALSVTKGGRRHRLFGTVFFVSMLVMAAMGAYLATLIPQRGTVAVGVLTFYFVLSAWVTVRREEGSIGLFEKIAPVFPLVVAATLFLFGVQAKLSPAGLLDRAPALLYFVFAGFAAFVAALDLKVVLRGGVAGVARLTRHLWRMCFALFFASASFFLGQQKAMPAFLHGSPVLTALALAPLLAMIFWLIRVRWRFKPGAANAGSPPSSA